MMGRGQQMSSFSMADTVMSTTSGKEFWIMNRRKLVAMFAIFLTLVITSSYMYFTSPDASTEAMMFFKGQPVSNFSSLTGSTNTSIFDSNSIGNDTEVESNFEAAGNTTDSLGTQPVEKSIDAEMESNFEDTGNTTDSLGTQPVGESIEPVSGAEDEEAKQLDPISETAISANSTSPALGFRNQELDNMTIPDSLKNFTSTNVNTFTDASKQRIPDDISSSHQQTEQSIIEMEGQGLSNVTSKGVCDLLKGRWVPDTRQPAYTNATCNFIQEAQNCIKNGRPDTGFVYWKWQPEQCDLPRIDHRAFLTAMRDRCMVFVGDSIARNQFQSLLCLLSQSERPENTYTAPDNRDKVFIFRSYNFTMAVYWSPYLVHVESKQIAMPNNSTEIVPDVHLDKLDEALVGHLPGVDILQISTGQWWFKFAYYLQNGQSIGCHTWPGWPECNDLGYAYPYHMALHNILQGVLSIPGFTGTTIFRSFSPDHFEGGSWSSNGQCVRIEPGGVPISALSKTMYEVQIQVFQNVTGALSASEKHRLRLLDITNLSQERPDGHPNAYRTSHPFSNKNKGQRIQKDCLHWCLPGPIDTWNELLVETLRDAVYR